jgi:hypothetical protein
LCRGADTLCSGSAFAPRRLPCLSGHGRQKPRPESLPSPALVFGDLGGDFRVDPLAIAPSLPLIPAPGRSTWKIVFGGKLLAWVLAPANYGLHRASKLSSLLLSAQIFLVGHESALSSNEDEHRAPRICCDVADWKAAGRAQSARKELRGRLLVELREPCPLNPCMLPRVVHNGAEAMW